jgi:hypothetical protein
MEGSLREELAEGVRSPRFRMALARQVVMLTGVFALGWPAHEVAVFFLLEAFLFLCLRAAAEMSLDERYGVVARRPLRVAAQIALHLLVTVPFSAIIVGLFGAFALSTFPDAPWLWFVREGIREPSFLGAVALLAGSIVYDTALFARRVAAGRSPEERARDDEVKWLALARLPVLAISAGLLGVATLAGFGPRVLAVAVAATLLYVEAVPKRAAQLFQPKVD